MSLILNIDTAFDEAGICLADNGSILYKETHAQFKDHATWLHPAIATLLKKNNCSINDLHAIAVNNGPGSYTGLRVGLAAAKGFCFATGIPLITISSLQILANAVKEKATDFICPMIDARRMEVFTALYDKQLNIIQAPHALIIDKNSFDTVLANKEILFCGNAVNKVQPVIASPNAQYINTKTEIEEMAKISANLFHQSAFADLAYAEPFYVKDFYSPSIKK